MVGRDGLLEEFDEALVDGPGASGRASIYTGARGSGKTVLLNAVEDRARARGWVVISETATPGIVARLTEQHLPRALRAFDPSSLRRRVTGASAPLGGGSLSWDTIEAHAVRAGLRTQVEFLTELLAEGGGGLLLTVDQIHRNQIADLREIATTVQHAFRESRELAFAGAGLDSAVSDVLNDDVLTFLRRAERHTLGTVGRAEVKRGLREPIEMAGRSVSGEALDVMVDGTQGYPFLLQLVGARTWRRRPDEPERPRRRPLPGGRHRRAARGGHGIRGAVPPAPDRR